MSNGQKSDWAETQRQLIEPCPVINGKTWLRHKSDSQAGLIDLRLLEGNSSVEDIASELNETFLPSKPIKERMRRVLDHIEHLQHGDTKGNISGLKPHELKLNEIQGKWCFVANWRIEMSKPEEIVPPLYVRVDKELKDKVELEAKKNYMSVSAYVRMAISKHIKAVEREE